MKKTSIALVSLALLTSCSGDVKSSLGLKKQAPDEFSVVSHPPLSVPPEFSLPNPGEKQAGANAPKVRDGGIFKENSGGKKAKLTADEKKFLENMGIQSDAEIRQQIDKEYQQKKAQKEDQGMIRKAITKLNDDTNQESLEPMEEKQRILKAKEDGKPINEGEVEMKKDSRSVLEKIFN